MKLLNKFFGENGQQQNNPTRLAEVYETRVRKCLAFSLPPEEHYAGSSIQGFMAGLVLALGEYEATNDLSGEAARAIKQCATMRSKAELVLRDMQTHGMFSQIQQAADPSFDLVMTATSHPCL